MLLELHVKNFAIIDEIEVSFREHLNILTGETGSGKSILIGSLNCALGGKVSRDMIRRDAEYAYVEIVFDTDRAAVSVLLKKNELPENDGQVVISRRIMQNGKSISKVNGESCTIAVIRELAEILLDIHGQHEHQSLLYKKNHLLILDRYAKLPEEAVLPLVGESYREYSRCKKALAEESVDLSTRQREISLLEYECNEIKAANLRAGEKEELTAKYKILSNQKQILEAVNACYQLTESEDTSAAGNIGRAVKGISRVAELDERLGGLHQQLSEIEGLLYDFNRELSEYLSDTGEESESLTEITERLDLIHHLESKYGEGTEQILEYLARAEEKLEKYADYDTYLERLKRDYEKAEKALRANCSSLSSIRREEAKKLSVEISDALRELNFAQVSFEICINESGSYSEEGSDEAEFLISLNPGEKLQPLAKIASGGELSRIMLGIKSVLADKDEIETLIFDEIDTGISGRTAQKVSERLAVIAKMHQVICITHLPQIAAMADCHYRIEKTNDGQRTSTCITAMAEQERTEEIARLLGGAKITDSVIKNAEEMKALADETKQNLRNR